ncbi:DUF1499 domain-containing protein [Aliigemmobacter aestuarii]|uniref:DUF1499 domain-containing protein n=1 Tax=Aliigemmobacter aestuarii TaxID=1445661 RepID=A0A4S3MLB9_9RHOB|nr:DUF1499 domain-containing protein [Gemmobacter aestuarii]THD82956.1 DUF1499 domain-containing protein [Gemmobacter aestuarii]
MKGLLALLLILPVLAFAGWVRLAPADPARWHVAVDPGLWGEGAPWDRVIPLTGGALLRLSPDRGAPAELLARLDREALSDPRTRRLAGSPDAGRITWESRSLIWGFPDYITAEVREDGLYLHARLRFGRSDLGVNAARLADWLGRLR